MLIDQSMYGNRWNSLGYYIFRAGEGEVVMTNEGTTTCATFACYWIADAFKFVLKPPQYCPPYLPPSPPAPPQLPPSPPQLPWPPGPPPLIATGGCYDDSGNGNRNCDKQAACNQS